VFGVCDRVDSIAEIKWECEIAAQFGLHCSLLPVSSAHTPEPPSTASVQTAHPEADLAPAAHQVQVRDGCKLSTTIYDPVCQRTSLVVRCPQGCAPCWCNTLRLSIGHLCICIVIANLLCGTRRAAGQLLFLTSVFAALRAASKRDQPTPSTVFLSRLCPALTCLSLLLQPLTFCFPSVFGPNGTYT
jgi:hypothetical protein